MHLPANPDEKELGEHVRRLRRLHPMAPLVLCAVAGDVATLVHAERLAATLGVRGVFATCPPEVATLRQVLTDTAGLDRDIACWLRDTGRVEGLALLALTEALVETTAHAETLAGACRRAHLHERGVRRAFARSGALSPGGLVRLALGLRLAMRLQQRPAEPLAAVARDIGASGEALAKRLRPLFGVRPSVVRELFGLPPLLERWWRREHPPDSGR